MNDIVKQLRNLAEYSDDIINVNPSLLIEAADEIERLRNYVSLLKEVINVPI